MNPVINVLLANAGKRPEEIINALYRQGFAVVPLSPPTSNRLPDLNRWRDAVDAVRVRA